MAKNIELGKTYSDKITGFKGVATGHCGYLSGCNQTLLVPAVKDDGSFQEGQWFDDQRMVVDDAVDKISLDNGKTPGCDIEAPK